MVLKASLAWAGTCPGSNGPDGAPGRSAGAASGPACACNCGGRTRRGGGRRGCASRCCRPAGSKQPVRLWLIYATRFAQARLLHAAVHATDASKKMVLLGSPHCGLRLGMNWQACLRVLCTARFGASLAHVKLPIQGCVDHMRMDMDMHAHSVPLCSGSY